ncbi:uncharacterized protein [Physcomitrium patens]|uniref:EF-hand domain-containing protein n=1 Tax=Physcomitrium patens TaxID=3218 RepID=A0A2K1IDE3_PHYPA|nr:calmodulin-beta-like [Physcomitrium patens]PNR27299.1 hypothetical protein PHYPA_029451 [Physcomitrium patens]|eukprot:XP_024365301.1 calmodulin-beta-like [Physcomitrella patens]
MCYEGVPGSNDHRRSLERSEGARGAVVWQESQLKEAFDMMDRDGDGTIKAEDLSHFLQYSLKSNLSSEEIENMISLADRDGNGAVDFDEFMSLVSAHVPQAPESLSSLGYEALRQIFRVLDRNGDDVLCSDDLSGVMGSLGQCLSLEDLLAMVETATGSDQRKVNFEDFCQLMSSALAELRYVASQSATIRI